jgi:hypothetical protein
VDRVPNRRLMQGAQLLQATMMLLVCFLVGGITNGMQNVARPSLVRLRTPEHLHGRAFAAVDSAMRTSVGIGTLTVFATREREPARVVETTRAG